MLQLNPGMIILLMLFAILCVLAIKLPENRGRLLQARLPAFFGIFVITGAYLFQPWVVFNFIRYVIKVPEVIAFLLPPEIVAMFAKLLGTEWLSKLINYFIDFTNLNGIRLQFIPTFGFWARTWSFIPYVLCLPVFIGALFGMIRPGAVITKILGTILVVLSGVAFLGLFFTIPVYDNLGTSDSFQLGLLASLMGSQVGNGPWWTLLGLVGFVIEGFVEINAQPRSIFDSEMEFL